MFFSWFNNVNLQLRSEPYGWTGIKLLLHDCKSTALLCSFDLSPVKFSVYYLVQSKSVSIIAVRLIWSLVSSENPRQIQQTELNWSPFLLCKLLIIHRFDKFLFSIPQEISNLYLSSEKLSCQAKPLRKMREKGSSRGAV